MNVYGLAVAATAAFRPRFGKYLHLMVRSTGCKQLRRLATFLLPSPVNSGHALVNSLKRLLPAFLSFERSHCGIAVRLPSEEESFDESSVV